MDFFHCNVCYIQPEATKSVKFFLTNCGHSFCHNCLDPKSNRCKLCHCECKIIPLSNDMPENLKAFFNDTVQEAKKIIRILTVQNNHCKIYMEEYVPYLEKKCMHFDRKLEEKNKEIDSLNNKLKLMSTQMEGMKRDMIKITSKVPKTPIAQKQHRSEFKMNHDGTTQYRAGYPSVFMTPSSSLSSNTNPQHNLAMTPFKSSQKSIPNTPNSMYSQRMSGRRSYAPNPPSLKSTSSSPQSFYSSQTFVMKDRSEASSQKSNVKQIRASNLRQIKTSLTSRVSNLNSSYF